MKRIATFICCLALVGNVQAQKKNGRTKTYPLTASNWSTKSDNAEFVTYKGVAAVKSSNDSGFNVVLKEVEFGTGTIEFDVELKGRGFPGINFRLDEANSNSEFFYLRYFGQLDPLSRNRMQYAAIMDGINLWDLTDPYQAAAEVYENRWNHIKLVVSEQQMKVYVNDMERPALLVPKLEGLNKTGKIGLTGNVIYANLTVTPNAIEDLPNRPGFDLTYNDPNYLRNWQVLAPIDFPTGKDVMRQVNGSPGVVIDSTYLDGSKSWKTIKTGPRAMLNLTKEFGATPTDARRLVWLKTTVTAKEDLRKRLKMGFSDEVWVFVNGAPLHQNKNYYGSPGMKEPKGRCTLDNTAFEVPMQKGENEILIAVSNYFFGWGLIARWDNTDGLSY
ncbi:MAG: hypothetical protein HRT65_01865 [Flavobacteriaceae bacterium]|nr:hypothetical protein [Flavobacteriaceae bacterium]